MPKCRYNNGSNAAQAQILSFIDIKSLPKASNAFGPEVFGSAMWFIMHTAAAAEAIRGGNLSLTDLDMWERWLTSLWIVIPCESCRVNYQEIIQHVDFNNFSTGMDIFKLTVDLHNHVNASLNKPHISLLKAKQIYGINSGKGPQVILCHSTTPFV